ncbi:MAG TPA: IclR family transcriptional regulator [Propionibacteriaceae bacterium]|nr:IclR family transcriptional regulator [Propionibacteriaceae bacterium]
MAGNSAVPGRSVVSKISAILLALTEGNGYTLTEIAARCELPLSTVHRLATELAAWSLLERDDEGRYRAGPPLRTLGGGHPSPVAANLFNFRERIAPVMEDLFRTAGVQVRAGLLDGTEVAYVEKVSGHLPVTWPSPAAHLPAHATALGKALLAFAPTATVDLIVAGSLKQYTRATITRAERLRSALRMVRTTRIALCDRELDEDWAGVAAPVFGTGGAVLAAIELRVQHLQRDITAVQAPLSLAAACLSQELAAQRWTDDQYPFGRRDLRSTPTAAVARAICPVPTHSDRRMEVV